MVSQESTPNRVRNAIKHELHKLTEPTKIYDAKTITLPEEVTKKARQKQRQERLEQALPKWKEHPVLKHLLIAE